MAPSVVSVFVILVLLVGVEAQGSRVTAVLVQEGEDLLLEAEYNNPEGYFIVRWQFNKTVDLVRFVPRREPAVSSDFTGRIEFTGKRFSVKLKNLQLADSGVYTADVSQYGGLRPLRDWQLGDRPLGDRPLGDRPLGDRPLGDRPLGDRPLGDRPLGDRTLAEYKVTVQAPVSPVKLSVVSVVSRSSASCDLTVNCSTQDSHISSTFTCVDGACSQEGGGGRSEVTTSGASLQVYLLNSSIVCHHSNQVHWTKDFKGTQHVCCQHAGSEAPSAGPSVYLVKIVVFSVGLIIMVAAVITVHLMEKLHKHK
ncbi:uncharacterized protein LOC117746063 isoform X1 [Cyclopterus lumpus]|uniref:uncharacterized protein LOC117746063 isoform X1 n=1 Tax=Cyclopterus lumpus TaxID=8103 RepID=UPI001486608F|nr:uncharacterized protein LOC117746063 isoform X1 [Cyclopterus lumpus]